MQLKKDSKVSVCPSDWNGQEQNNLNSQERVSEKTMDASGNVYQKELACAPLRSVYEKCFARYY